MVLVVRVLCGCGAALWLRVWHDGEGDRVQYLADGPVTHCPACGALLGLDVVKREGAGDG